MRIITGGNSGAGKATAAALAEDLNWHIRRYSIWAAYVTFTCRATELPSGTSS